MTITFGSLDTVVKKDGVEYTLVAVKVYNQLVDDSLTLDALVRGGVDNWEGYNESIREFKLDTPIIGEQI